MSLFYDGWGFVAGVFLAMSACSGAASSGRADAADADTGAADASLDTSVDEMLESIPLVGSIQATSVAVKSSGNIVVAGLLEGTVDLGKGPLTSAGNTDLVVAEFAPSGTVLWNRHFGNNQPQAGALLAIDGVGNTFVATNFAGALELGGGALTSAGNMDVGLVALDAAGNYLWSRQLGDAALQFPVAIVTEASGEVVLSVHTGSGLPNEGVSIVKLSAAGEPLWTKSWLGVEAPGLAPTASGGVVMAGWFRNTIDLGGGPLSSAGQEDILVLELGPSGDWVWNKRFGGSSTDRALAMAVDATGALVLTGEFSDTLDFGGEPLVSVMDPSRFGPSADMFLAKLDARGAHRFSRRFGDTLSDQAGTHLTVAASGDLFVVGNGGVSIDLGLGALVTNQGLEFVAQFDGDGQALWNTTLPRPPSAVHMTASGGALVAGGFPTSTVFPATARTFTAGDKVFLIEYQP